ncbi:MAG: hypothetical protein CMF39_03380 [Legionellaceae bacterium]|nr:hypothetical protein [Legionellaceae bacterium]|tara:strand:+ start:107 stop:337 length:231 start_codon:yes stop_codon:yes gene_type:complete
MKAKYRIMTINFDQDVQPTLNILDLTNHRKFTSTADKLFKSETLLKNFCSRDVERIKFIVHSISTSPTNEQQPCYN